MNEIQKLDHLDNIGSIVKVWYIPNSHVSSMQRPIHGFGGISLLANKDWLQFYFSPESGSLTFDFKTDAKGSFFICMIKGVFPKLEVNNAYNFRQMQTLAFICKVLDANGNFYIIGTKDCPMKFSYGFASGEETADRNSVAFKFFGNTQYAPFFLTSAEGSQD